MNLPKIFKSVDPENGPLIKIKVIYSCGHKKKIRINRDSEMSAVRNYECEKCRKKVK